MKKIIIVGVTGSGKSTFSKSLSQRLNIPHIQLDSLYWKANWEGSSDEEFFAKIEKAIDQLGWIVDGNYNRSNHLTWKNADTVIWIDFPFWLTFYQNVSRSITRAIIRKEIWEGTGNRESFLRMFSKDSIVLWLFKVYWKQEARYQERMNDSQFKHITFYRLKSRREVSHFLENL